MSKYIISGFILLLGAILEEVISDIINKWVHKK